jgi:ADP-ribosyl-[dinitrogen reductase] hydrolase
MHFVPPVARFEGCLLGGAIGDALGFPIEFDTPGAGIVARYGSSAPRDLAFTDAPALVSDDTQMTLFTLEGLIRGARAGAKSPTPHLLSAYQRWYGTQEMRRGAPAQAKLGHGLLLADARLHARRAPGNTCLSALAQSFMGRPTPTLATPPNNSKGCGAIMRSAPFGLFARTRQQAFGQARDAGVLTHGHPSGYLSGAYFAALIFDLARDVPLGAAMDLADAELAHESEIEELGSVLVRARKLASQGLPSVDAIERLGGGWTGEEALAIAIVCALSCQSGTPEAGADALWRAVAHGGDSDSTGSLTGNLLGAQHGLSAFPAAWQQQVEMSELILRLARDLHAVALSGGAAVDVDAYPA